MRFIEVSIPLNHFFLVNIKHTKVSLKSEYFLYILGFDSSSSVTWDQFLRSSLVSGQGLSIAGASPEFARKEVEKIHEENVLQLSAMTEDEILQEQEKMKKLLGMCNNYGSDIGEFPCFAFTYIYNANKYIAYM